MEQKEMLAIRERLERVCVKRECCSQEVYRKALKACEGDEAAARQILDSLLADAFVDDGRYAAAFAREKSALSGWGRLKIATSLRAKGISRQCIDQAWAEVDENKAIARLEKVLSSKWAVLKDDPYGRFKLIKYALTRGYEYDEVSCLVDKLIKEQL